MAWLVSIGAWLWKLLGGFLPIGTKPFPEWLGKIVFWIGMFVLCMFAWKWITRDTNTTVIKPDQDAEQIVNVYHQEQVSPGTFGCATVKQMDYYKSKPEVKGVKAKPVVAPK